ncbi:DUF5819 family protein [Streptomyces sp. NPDC048290]|uniref:DUF5819 family protein n=1 Tax=Streptomyces sp. NPDC048290 TaxID=3155811 RepID=UPI00341979E8
MDGQGTERTDGTGGTGGTGSTGGTGGTESDGRVSGGGREDEDVPDIGPPRSPETDSSETDPPPPDTGPPRPPETDPRPPETDPPPPDDPRTGIAALSLPYRVGVALALAVVAVAVCVHLGMVFLHVAPANTVSKRHAATVDAWIYPEFEQNWKLFAPNPLQQNVAVQVRAQIRTPDGGERTTGWHDLSAADGRAIDGNPVPSHTQQNSLRRAWDYYVATHDGDNRATGPRGTLAETYVRRLVVLRLTREGVTGEGGVVERVQVRSSTSNVEPPAWSEEKIALEPVYRVLPWWQVPDEERAGGTG